MVKQALNINLLRDRQKGAFEKFLDWALTVGRFLVLVTEAIAITMFVYSVILWRTLGDLNDEITRNQAAITAQQEFETTARSLQARLAVIKVYDESPEKASTIAKDVVSLARGKMVFKTVGVSQKSITIDASTPSSALLNSFIEALRKHPDIYAVSLDKVENNTSEGIITANISLSLVQVANAAIPEGGETAL